MSPFAKERRLAELAVQRAALLTDKVYHAKVKGTITKEDKSPVTLADLGGQALVIAAIRKAFPEDAIVGEEDSEQLRQDTEKRDLLWGWIKEVLDEGKVDPTEVGTVDGVEDMLALIDRGNSEGGAVGRIWALDPVDGTKGFLRGGQYAVALGLLVDGKVVVGAMACPNLPLDPANPEGPKGVLLSAERGQGTTLRAIDDTLDSAKSVSATSISKASEGSFCEGVESGHSDQTTQSRIALRLGITKPSVRMDSQAKYASVARGDGDIYLRLPTSATYEEKIWDHAAGSIICEEAGAIVSDSQGKPLDFSLGKTLKHNKGVIVASKGVHAEVISVVMEEIAKL